MAQQAVKVTLSSQKVVVLRQMRISDAENAAKEVSKKAGGDSFVLQILSQKALVKNLLLQIDGKKITAAEREDMDSLFSVGEYSQLVQVINKMSGGDDLGEASIEVMISGDTLPGSPATQV